MHWPLKNRNGSCYRKGVHYMNCPAGGVSVWTLKLEKCVFAKRDGPSQRLFHQHIRDFIWLPMKRNRMLLPCPFFVIQQRAGSTKNFMCLLFVLNPIYDRKQKDIMHPALKRVQ